MASKNQIIVAKEIKINFITLFGVILLSIIIYGILYVSKMPPLVPDYKDKRIKYEKANEKAKQEQIEFAELETPVSTGKASKTNQVNNDLGAMTPEEASRMSNLVDLPIPSDFFPNGTIEYDNGLSYDDMMNGKINEHRMKRFYDDIMTISQNVFYILLIGLIVGRYLLLSVKWVIKTSKIDLKE